MEPGAAFFLILVALAVAGGRRRSSGDSSSVSRPHRRDTWRDDRRSRDVSEARWGRGPLAGRTGDPFVDDPFFNPWAPGGDFNRD